MNTRADLTKYEEMYSSFDGGHNKLHLEEVRDFAVKLGKKYCPEKLELIWVAATLHDVGLSVSREDHEFHSHEIIIKDKELAKSYSKEELEEIFEAVKEHRASNGNPKGIVARIVSDADKVADGTVRAFQRAYQWGIKHFPQVEHYGQIMRAGYHIYVKFGPNGTGNRLYFEESLQKHAEIYKPIFEAMDVPAFTNINFSKLEDFLKEII